MTEELHDQARKVAEDLRVRGHARHAEEISGVLGGTLIGDAFLKALRGVCDTLLTVVEAIDPVSELALEDLRLSVDRHLEPKAPPEVSPTT